MKFEKIENNLVINLPIRHALKSRDAHIAMLRQILYEIKDAPLNQQEMIEKAQLGLKQSDNWIELYNCEALHRLHEILSMKKEDDIKWNKSNDDRKD